MTSSMLIKLKVSAVVLVIFVLGVVTGLSLNGLRAGIAGPGSAQRDPNAYYESLRRELDLNAEQSSQIKSILEETRVEYRKICSEARPRYESLREQARSRMRPLLSSAQQEKFDSIILQEDCSTCPDRTKTR